MEVTGTREMAWVGVDIGKTHHWVCALDGNGTVLQSVKVANDEAELLALIARVGALADRFVWAVDTSARLQRCCWRCWPTPASRCGMRRAGWSRR